MLQKKTAFDILMSKSNNANKNTESPNVTSSKSKEAPKDDNKKENRYRTNDTKTPKQKSNPKEKPDQSIVIIDEDTQSSAEIKIIDVDVTKKKPNIKKSASINEFTSKNSSPQLLISSSIDAVYSYPTEKTSLQHSYQYTGND